MIALQKGSPYDTSVINAQKIKTDKEKQPEAHFNNLVFIIDDKLEVVTFLMVNKHSLFNIEKDFDENVSY